jgi:hypothetical protein
MLAISSSPKLRPSAIGLHESENEMSNPWSKKNPLMSMWLSAVNRGTGAARGQAVAAAKRQVALNNAEAARQIVDFWSGMGLKPAPIKKRGR